jgi:hypothetical protein
VVHISLARAGIPLYWKMLYSPLLSRQQMLLTKTPSNSSFSLGQYLRIKFQWRKLWAVKRGKKIFSKGVADFGQYVLVEFRRGIPNRF